MAKVLDKVLLRRLKCRRGKVGDCHWANRLSGFNALVFRDRYSVVQEIKTERQIKHSILRYTLTKHSETVFGPRPEGWVASVVLVLMQDKIEKQVGNAQDHL